MSKSWNEQRIEWEYIDQMELIREQRRYLQSLISEQPNNPYWQWMKEWLAQSDEEHFQAGDLTFHCDMCGSIPRHIWHTEFSFCNEYGCGMDLCDECIMKLAEEVRRVRENSRS